MKKKLGFVIALLLLPLSGCGIISIGYNYADAYLRYSINSYASFNDEQKSTIKKEVNDFMLWHRANMLPEYVSFLQELRKTAQSGATLTKEDVARFRSEVRTLYIKTLQPTVRPAALLLSSVKPAQIEELASSFAKENNKQKDKELSGSLDEQMRKRSQRTIDFIENLVGGFSDKQLEKVRDMNRRLPFATGLYIRLREDNQARLIELLQSKMGAEDIAAFLSAWLVTPEAGRSPDEQSTLLAFENASDEITASVYAMLTDRQKKTLLKNIVKYIDTFQDLAGKNSSARR
ncbi:MAG TPA: DUF6279 family lipoprotein [Gallionellaceae bacterium]|nr:DUF6279 family lipoprotein [Gallionellaceae bacterium]